MTQRTKSSWLTTLGFLGVIGIAYCLVRYSMVPNIHYNTGEVYTATTKRKLRTEKAESE